MKSALSRMARALVAVCLAAGAVEGQGRSYDLDDPVEVLLELYRPLQLSRAQVTALREIQRELHDQNAPLIEEILAVQRRIRADFIAADTDGRRREFRPTEAQLSAFREPMERIQANNLTAMKRVGDLLTDSQKRRAAMLIRVRDRRRDWRDWRGAWPRFPGGDR